MAIFVKSVQKLHTALRAKAKLKPGASLFRYGVGLIWFRTVYRIGRWRALKSVPRKAIVAELGVWKGEFSGRILKTAQPKELYLIDLWEFNPSFPSRTYGGLIAKNQQDMDAMMKSVVDAFAASPQVRILRESTISAATRFPDRYFDWIYIDANHSYEAVLGDLRLYYPKMKPGGLILIDDYYWRDESRRRSVRDAIHTFLRETRVGKATPLMGQFLIRVAS
jgi:Methyltransferase domain